MAVNVLVSAYHPFPKTISLSLPAASPARATLSYVLDTLCPVGSQSLSLRSGRPIPDDASFSDLGSSDVHVRLAVRLPGGKGGFGSQLRAAGGRMNSKKNGQNNTDSCRDLNGRRLSTIKEAKKLAEYLEGAPQREAARIEEAKGRLAKLRAEIERADSYAASNPTSSAATATTSSLPPADFTQDATASSSTAEGEPAAPVASARAAPATSAQPGQKRRRLEDQKYVEESRELVDNVKNAVAAAILKKRKMKKDAAATSAPATSAGSSGVPDRPAADSAAPAVSASA